MVPFAANAAATATAKTANTFEWLGQPQKFRYPLGFRHPAGRGPSDGHWQHVQEN